MSNDAGEPTEREKSISEKKLEKVLGINDQLRKLDDEEKTETIKSDEEKIRKIAERKKYLEEMKGEMAVLKKKDDIEFSKDIYKELAMIDMEILRITRKEMEIDPSPRYVETLGALTNAIVGAVDSLRNVDKVKVEQGFEREKIDMKKNAAAPGGNISNSVVMIGQFTDIMDKVAEMKALKEKTIEVEVIKESKKD